jgi:hypothetical protein
MLQPYKRIYDKESESVKPLEFTSYSEAVKMNYPFKLNSDRIFYNTFGKKIMKEGISFEFEDKGGIIVFSTDVNAMLDSKGFLNKIKGFFRGRFETIMNRLKRNSKLSKVLSSFQDIQAYSVGNFFKGRYFDRKNSFIIDFNFLGRTA